MKELFLLKLGEIVLKGQNRRVFEDKLKTVTRRRMVKFGEFKVSIVQSTLYVEPLTDVPGASAVYKGGVISYVNEIKHRLLGVEQEILDVCTAVSRETAHEMARGARERLAADCAVSVTGLAGPDGDGTGRPVGLVYIAVDTAGFSFCKELHLSGDRAKIREQAADAVFQLILDTI